MSAQDAVVRSFVSPGETVAVGASSVQSALFPNATKTVRCTATVDCWIELGTNPTAAANTSTFLPAGAIEYFAATAGMRLAVIRASTDGSLYVRETD